MTRVLHVLEALEGGTARHVQDLVRFTPDIDQHLAVPPRRVGAPTDDHAIGALHAAGATVHVVPMTRRPPTATNAQALPALVRLARRVGADVVHTHSSVGGALGRAAATVARIPRVHTPNGVYAQPAALALERILGRITDRLVAVSPSEGELVLRLGLVAPGRLVVIPNGIDPDLPTGGPDLRILADIPAAAPLIVSVGRLIAQKAPLDVVEAFARVLRARPDAYALLIGDGSLRPEVDRALRAPDVAARLRYIPAVADVAAGLGAADVVMLLSRFEGAPYVPLEAMRAGTPVVASDVVGTRDAIRSGHNGVLVPERNPAAAAAAVLSLLADPTRLARLGAAGPLSVRQEHSALSMGAAYAALYSTLSGAAPRTASTLAGPAMGCDELKM